LELKQYVQFVGRWLVLFALFGILGAFGGVLFSREPVMYTASTKLMTGTGRPTVNTPSPDSLQVNEILAQTYAELLVARPIMETVVQNLKLNIDPGTLASRTSVTLTPNTNVLVLTVTDSDRQVAANIANEIVRVFNQQASDLLSNPFALSVDTLRVVEPAQPGSRVPSQASRTILLSIVVGLLFAAAVGFLIDYFDDRMKSSAVVERLAGLPTLATIPRLAGADLPDTLVTLYDSQTHVAETYRMLRSQIEAVSATHPIQTILITSGTPREGKSTTAANLAIGLAQTGKRVILVDTDLRRPTLHIFFQRSNQRGVTTALTRQKGDTISSHLVATDIKNLLLMPSGSLSLNPTELLGSPRFSELVEDLKTQTDIVVFDSPALLNVVDPMLIARESDAALLVVQASRRADTVIKARDQLMQSGAHLLGVVLNRASVSRKAYDNYYDNKEGTWQRLFGQRSQKQDSAPLHPIEGLEVPDLPKTSD
jgi:capsular exopolysaccharide synthesis family protein